MTTIEKADVFRAEDFLVSFLEAAHPDADFGANSALRDVAVRSIALVFAYLQAEGARVRALSELDSILEMTDADEQLAAMENYASNLLLSINSGEYGRGLIQIEFDTNVTSGSIPPGALFVASNQFFTVDNGGLPKLFSTSDMTLSTASSGSGLSYYLLVPIVSTARSSEVNVGVQEISQYTRFNNNIRRVRLLESVSSGSDSETAAQFAARLPEAVSVRNLLTKRSIYTVLRDAFSSILDLRVIGAGDVEMMRDLSPFSSPENPVHMGGAADIYVRLPTTTRTVEHTLGAQVTLAGPRVYFSDLFYSNEGMDWRGLVRVGDYIRFYNVNLNTPTVVQIVDVQPEYVMIGHTLPFRSDTGTARHSGSHYEGCTRSGTTITFPDDSQLAANDVGKYVLVSDGYAYAFLKILSVQSPRGSFYSQAVLEDLGGALAPVSTTNLHVGVYEQASIYSIGTNAPNYDNKIELRNTGRISNTVSFTRGVPIIGSPVYRVRSLSLLNSDTSLNNAPEVGTSYIQSSSPPTLNAGVADNTYQLKTLNPHEALSSRSNVSLELVPVDGRSGSEGALSVIDAEEATISLTVPNEVFRATDVGLQVILWNSVFTANDGVYFISEFVDTKTVTLTRRTQHHNIGASIVDDNSGGVSWEIATEPLVQGTYRVVYDTAVGFDTIAAYVENSDNRVICSDTLVRAFYPVFLTFTLNYSLKPNTTTPLNVVEAVDSLTRFINEFSALDILNTNDIVTHFRTSYPQVGNVQVLTVTYILTTPRGPVVAFRTQDEIAVKEHLLLFSQQEELRQAVSDGVSDRVTRYYAAADRIILQEVDA